MKALLISLLLSVSTLAAERVALVIGNNVYDQLSPSMQLTSPKNDAADVAAALQRLGYTLVNDGPVIDASRDAITTATEKFAIAARDAEAAVFYFSGHGIQVGEDNYLLPSDTPKLTGLSTLNNRAILLRNSVMVALEEAGAETKVIILDCCRDNPFSAQLEQALAQVGKSIKTKSVGEITGYGSGFYLAFATSPGSTAADGNGDRNSPFTAAMLKALPSGASKDIDFYFRDVKSLLPRDQVSWTNHSIHTNFSLAPGVGGTELLTPTQPRQSGSSSQMQSISKPPPASPPNPLANPNTESSTTEAPQVIAAETGKFNVALGTFTPTVSFKTGDLLTLKVRINRDAYLRVIYQPAVGDPQLLFPEQGDGSEWVPGGRDVFIPDPVKIAAQSTDASAFQLYHDFGTGQPLDEQLIIQVSATPITDEGSQRESNGPYRVYSGLRLADARARGGIRLPAPQAIAAQRDADAKDPAPSIERNLTFSIDP
jgi:hypothetical protein